MVNPFIMVIIDNASCILDEPAGGNILDINVINSV